MRSLDPKRPIIKHSGLCASMSYEIPCPLKNQCEAYKRARKST